MKLSLLQRIVMPIPKEGKYEDMIVADDIRKKIVPTQEEVETYGIKSIGTGGLTWNKEGIEAEFEMEFTELELSLIKKELEKLNTSEKLSEETIGLYKLFCK